MIQFIHTADIHFGMENYGRIDTQTGIHTRLLDFVRALNYCIDVAIDRHVDFFLFAGDAYKTAHPSPTQQKLFMQCFLRLYTHKIPVIIVVGNHDHPLSFGKANALDIFSDLPVDGFYVITKPTTHTIPTQHGPVQIVGIPWPTRNTIAITKKHLYKSAKEITDYIARAVAHIIKDKSEKLDPTLPAILTGHLTVSNGIFSGSEKRAIYGNDPVLLPSQLAIKPFDYVALGHLHRHQNLNQKGYPALVYSGSIERIDFGERKEEKGFCLVSIHAKNNTTYEFIPTPTRPFIQIEVTLNTTTHQTDQMIHEIKKYNLKHAVVKILYHIPEHSKDMVDLRAIQAACMEAHYIAGIIPIHKPLMRQRRSSAYTSESDIPTLIDNYFSSKPELKSKKKILLEKTIALLEQNTDKHESELL